jgi:hypothetical protein
MHQLPVAGNFPGFLFAVGSALIFLIAIPALWFVIAGAAAVGLAMAGVLQLVRRDLNIPSIRKRRHISSRRVLIRTVLD